MRGFLNHGGGDDGLTQRRLGFVRSVSVALTVACVGLLGDVATLGVKAAQVPVEQFYRGKVVTILVGFGAGGGYDLYARILSRHIGRHIPGRPTVIVQNMPGAGGLVMANHLFNAAPRDGSVFAILNPGNLVAQVVGDPAVRFDGRRLNWIGNMSEDSLVIYVRSDSPVQRLQDALTRPIRLGAPGTGTLNYFPPRLLNEVLGARFELILGYSGTNDIELAIERGEIHGDSNFWGTSLKPRKGEWFSGERPFARILVQFGYRRRQDLRDVPLAAEMA